MIETTDENGIAVLRINTPPISAPTFEVLSALPDALAAVADAKAVVLTGTDDYFAIGINLERIVTGGPDYVARFLPALSTAVLALFDHPKPVVAALNGSVGNGGWALAAACDLRVMSAGTMGPAQLEVSQLWAAELKAGLPIPTVPLEILRYVAGPAAANLVLTSREVDHEEAKAMGLVDVVTTPKKLLDQARHRASLLAVVPAEVYALTKEQLHRPVKERIEATRPRDDPRVERIWSSPETREFLKVVLEWDLQRT